MLESFVWSRRRILWLTGAAAGGMIAAPWVSVAAPPGPLVFDDHDPDEVECRRRLRLVFEALQRHFADAQRYPRNLSDLVDAGYIDARLLLCPAAVRRGDYSLQDPNMINDIGKERYTLYKYEYAPDTETHDRLNWQRQTEVGDWIAIVRCNEHRPKDAQFHLNLALNGAIYPSRLYWEQELLHLCPFFYLNDIDTLKSGPLPIYKRMPGRSGEAAPSTSADLTLHYNALLGDGWMTSEAVDSLAEFDRTLPATHYLSHRGVAFDVRGALVLDGGRIAAAALRPRFRDSRRSLFPTAARPIVATLQGSRLHALVGCFYEAERGAIVGHLAVRHGNGREQPLLLRYGENIAATAEEMKSVSDAVASPVWSLPPLPAHSIHTPRAVFHVVWEGLGPSQQVREIRFAAGDTNTCLFLLALSTSG